MKSLVELTVQHLAAMWGWKWVDVLVERKVQRKVAKKVGPLVELSELQ